MLEKPAAGDARTVVFIHGNVSSSLFWQPAMLALPDDVRGIAIDLRGFGDSETLPVDATRGLADFSDDVAAVLAELGITRAHFVGWSMGAGVMMQYLLDHGHTVESLTMIAPVSPYGFGGTTGLDGRTLGADGAGTGGGGVHPDFVARLEAGDTSDDGPTSPRMVYRTAYVKNPDGLPHEDIWVQSMLSTETGATIHLRRRPGLRELAGLCRRRPWRAQHHVAGELMSPPSSTRTQAADSGCAARRRVGDNSLYDLNVLGKIGAIPGWPGDDVAPAQPMIQQTRAILEQYQANGGGPRACHPPTRPLAARTRALADLLYPDRLTSAAHIGRSGVGRPCRHGALARARHRWRTCARPHRRACATTSGRAGGARKLGACQQSTSVCRRSPKS